MYQKEKKFKASIKWTLILSLLVHFIFMFAQFDDIKEQLALLKSKNKKEERESKIKVVLRKPVQKKAPAKKRQIVDSEDAKKKAKKPLDTRFLSKQNQKFDRQTVTKKVGAFKEAGKGIRKGSKKLKKKLVRKKVKKKRIVQKKRHKVKKKGKRKISLADLAVKKSKKVKKVRRKKLSAKSLGLKKGKLGKIGLSQNSDYIDDVPLGDVTNLNTLEYKYYGYYHRIKQKLEQYWGDELRQKAESIYKAGRRIPASEKRITSLEITIDTMGNIVDISIKTTSGISEFDDAAIESFNKAGPFPNPPKGMMKNGMAKIEWGFVVSG